jgi:hypothetical protein
MCDISINPLDRRRLITSIQAISVVLATTLLGGCASTDPPKVQYLKERADKSVELARLFAEHVKMDRSSRDSFVALLQKQKRRAHARAESIRGQTTSMEKLHEIDYQLENEISQQTTKWVNDHPAVQSDWKAKTDQISALIWSGAMGDPDHPGQKMIAAAEAAGVSQESQQQICAIVRQMWDQALAQQAQIAREEATTKPQESEEERQLRIERANFTPDPKMYALLLRFNDQLNQMMTPTQRAEFDSHLSDRAFAN